MTDMSNEVDRQFRGLHEDAIREYELQVKRWKDGLDERRKRAQADEKEIRDSLKASGTDLALLDRRAKRAGEELQKYLEASRPALLKRTSNQAADFKQRGLEASLLTEAPRVQIPPYAVSLTARDKKFLDDIEGEVGNLWVFPASPAQIKLSDQSTGDGWGCWAIASGPPPTATTWFSFIPNQTAIWELSPIFTFHGFMILRADDGIFTCKSAQVSLEAKINIYQYFWKGAKSYKLVDIDKDNVDTVDFYDRTQWIWDTQTLRAGDRVWVKVDISLDALAVGGGSYAEINFSSGSANYIEPLFMTTQVVG